MWAFFGKIQQGGTESPIFNHSQLKMQLYYLKFLPSAEKNGKRFNHIRQLRI
jgi:hypothetical protein